MIYLRQSTASQEIPLGYFVDSADGNTEETGLTIANTDIKIWKSGATTLASKNSGGATHISNGVYYCVLDATDTDTIGPLVVFIHVSGALTVRVECCVLDEAVYDVWFGTVAPATLSNITSAAGITLADNAITAAKVATGAIDADALAADAVAEIADGVWDEPVAGHVGAGTFGKTDADTLAAVDTEIAAIKAKTDNLPSDPADQSAVETAITNAQNAILAVLGALADAAADGDPTTGDTVMAYIKQLVNTLVGTTGIPTFPAATAPANNVSLAEALRQVYDEVAGLNGGALLDAAGVRSAVGLATANLDTQLTAIDDFLDTEVAAIKAKTDNLPTDPADASDIAAAFSSLNTKVDTIDDFLDTEIAAIKAKTDLLPEAPAKNTALTYLVKMVDSADHVTPKTGLTVTMTRFNGTAFEAATGTVSEVSTGHYKVEASAADMNFDMVTHRFTATGADDLTVEFRTVA